MKTTILAALAVLASAANALQIISPVTNSTVTTGQTLPVKWSYVDTDPSIASVYLVNFVSWPPQNIPLELDVNTTSGGANVKIPCDVAPGYGYQINLDNGTNTYVIYAQSGKFTVISDPNCVDTTETTPSSSAAAATASTVYKTLPASTVTSSGTVYVEKTVTVSAAVQTMTVSVPGVTSTVTFAVPTPVNLVATVCAPAAGKGTGSPAGVQVITETKTTTSEGVKKTLTATLTNTIYVAGPSAAAATGAGAATGASTTASAAGAKNWNGTVSTSSSGSSAAAIAASSNSTTFATHGNSTFNGTTMAVFHSGAATNPVGIAAALMAGLAAVAFAL
ncbi:hypothetical protein YB2330_003796 [Saitoella coloradoensis]